ncbi:MAG: tRNA dihydrouridine synthase DusB, partial [Gammaproteobacteria bacterium]|nr:tRNA dihydrouridine synthase DusB [Gammaproteobacteria bacterium]
MFIGIHKIKNNLILAPMAGVTDTPYRRLCRELGAGLAVSEMVSSNSLLWGSKKTRRRVNHEDEAPPCSVQILGTAPSLMADAARFNVDNGAQIIDINMGCPARKVCNVMAGAALLTDERRIDRILQAVVGAVDVPVTVKIRTGWDRSRINGVQVARIAERAGVQAITVHGRTRACGFKGEAEYATIAAIKSAVEVPVIANGDIRTPEKARQVLVQTGADGLMIGRAAQGNPWIFREVDHFLRTGHRLPPPTLGEVMDTMLRHLDLLYVFYGERLGVCIARKHLAWYS